MFPFWRFQKRNFNSEVHHDQQELCNIRCLRHEQFWPCGVLLQIQQVIFNKQKRGTQKFRTNIQCNQFQIFETVTNLLISSGWVQPLEVRTPSKVFEHIVGPSEFKPFFFHLHLKDVCFGF